MAAGNRNRVDGLLAQLVSELAELLDLERAQVGRRLDEVEEGGLGGLGHVQTPATRQTGNLTGWLEINQTRRLDQIGNSAKCLTRLGFSGTTDGNPVLVSRVFPYHSAGCTSPPRQVSSSHGTACELEGLSEVVPRFVRSSPLSGDDDARPRPLQRHQP